MPADAPRRPLLAATLAVVLAAVGALAVLSQTVERTPDERNYQLAGRVLAARQPLTTNEQRFQGPLILLGTQLTDPGGRASDDDVLRRARLGMLVFPALLLVVVAAWARQAFGPRAGLVAALAGATSPTLLAFGPLLSSDVPLAATGALAAWLAWRWLQRPTNARLLALGGAFGLLAATKYTAAIPIVGLALALLLGALRGFDPWPARAPATTVRPAALRLLRTLAALLLAGAIALATLYACYLFAQPPCSAATIAGFASGPMRALAALPGGAFVLGLLPEPMVLGLDYQAIWAGRTDNGTFGDARGNHWAYYPLTLLLKQPEPLWLFAALGVVRARAAGRGLLALALLPALLLLAYCSATRSLQMGVRYLLPCVPALWLLAGAAAEANWSRTRAGRVAWAVGGAIALLYVAAGWPRFVGWFPFAAGGPTDGFRVVADGNCDWDQRWQTGQDALRARHPKAVYLEVGQGPRIGLVAAYCDDLKAADPRDPTRCYHWLARFAPIDHDGAAWLLFAATPAAFAAAVARGDDRAAEDLAVAQLMDGDVAAARAALELVPAGRRGPSHAALQSLIEAIAAAGQEAAARDRCSLQASALGFDELALALADRGRRDNAVRIAALLLRTGRQRDGVRFLEAAGNDGSRTTEEVLLLAASLCDGGRRYAPDPMHALELMQQGPAPAADSPLLGPWREMDARVAAAIAREQAVARDR
jgi:4-amino-4-deoxy-L-arabinose transferase-like glycosyltransferase